VKFSKLYLKAFGPFTERAIDFDVPGASLHILYGPNEAGKSSLLRSIRSFLYGIPERTQDNFLYENTALRVGGLITDAAGHQLAAMRRKARKLSLRQWNGKVGADCEGEALADNAIFHFLGDIEEVQFSRLFGIDRDELIRGGQAILEGQGDVGASLFEAGSGLVGLRRLRDILEAEAGELFAPRASKPLINSTLSEYEGAKRSAKDAVVRTDEWVRREEAYTTVLNILDVNKNAISTKRLERERLARILRNLPMVARREECLKELANLSGVPDLALDFAEQRSATVTGMTNAERQRDEAQRKVTELETQLGGTMVPVGYIERETLIQGVYSRLGMFQQTELEIPGLVTRQRNLLEEASNKFRDLGLEGKLAEAERYRPKKGDQAKVRQLIKEHSDLSGRNAELHRQEIDLQADLEESQHTLSTLIQPQDPGRLDDAVQTSAIHADSERRLAEIVHDIEARKEVLTRKTRSLGDRAEVELRDLRSPSKATLQRLQQEAAAILGDHNVMSLQLAQRRNDLSVLQEEKKKLEAGGTVPSEDELAKARVHRERGWKLIRQGYIESTADPEKLAKEYVPEAGLPDAYEKAVHRADTFADGLRLDTERITKHAVTLDRAAKLYAAIAEDEAKLRDIDAQQVKWREEWAGITSSLGVSIATVRELEEWLGERDGIIAALGEIEQRQREACELQRSLSAAQAVLATEVGAHGVSVSGSDTFGALLAKARQLLANARRETARYEDAKKAVDELRGKLAGQRRRIEGLNAELVMWRSRWNAAVTGIGLAESIEPEEVEVRLALLEELFNAIDGAHRVGQELSEKQATIDRYSEEVRLLVAALGVNRQGKSVSDLVTDLFSQYQEAVKKAQRYEHVSKQLDGERQALDTLNSKLDCKKQELADLCRAAGVADVVELPAVEAKARRKKELQSDVPRIEKGLIENNSTALDHILEEAAVVDRDTLNVQILGLDEEINGLESSRISLAQQVRDAEVALNEVDGNEKAAEATQRAQELLAKLRNATEDYVRLKASSFVITRAIEAYRQKHQGPILRRASQYFLTLTCGSFKRLDVDFGEDDHQVLVGVRSDGKQVSVEGMSEGTRDQLYLALRLAAIESHLETGPPIPVIVDDILVQFDDVRAKAAFEALGMLATRTQVLLLTHHEHLLPLAEQAVTNGALVVHRL
jgi:uncharacterized protein YhaN